ncbi:MAG: hypothetical protein Q9157_007439 [Trypethelium eluteriae]
MASSSDRCYNDAYNNYNGNNCTYSSWDNWVRWVVLVVIVVIFLIVLFLFSCITARRRRRQGLRPYHGTGWLASGGRPNYNAQPYYASQNPQQPANNYNYGNNNAPPAYTPSNAGYYGQNYEMQAPQNAYHPNGMRDGETAYAPPSSPPPGKPKYGGQSDGVVR